MGNLPNLPILEHLARNSAPGEIYVGLEVKGCYTFGGALDFTHSSTRRSLTLASVHCIPSLCYTQGYDINDDYAIRL